MVQFVVRTGCCLFLMMILFCDNEEYHIIDEAEDVAKVYFSDKNYNISTSEKSISSEENKIVCKLVNVEDSRVRVEVEGETGNKLKMEFSGVNQTGNYDGRIDYYKMSENLWFIASHIEKVYIDWQGNRQMCEFSYDGPRITLTSASSNKVYLDSLKIQTLREDE